MSYYDLVNQAEIYNNQLLMTLTIKVKYDKRTVMTFPIKIKYHK